MAIFNLPDFELHERVHTRAQLSVYRGFWKKENKPVILKMIEAHPASPQSATLEHEFQIAKKIDSPGVVHPLAFFREGEWNVLVLEDFNGRSLAHHLNERPMLVSDFLRLAIPLAETLGDIHKNHVIHKDIKPSNIIYNHQEGIIKITDFSIASQLREEDQELLHPDTLQGTLIYLSPEQTGRMNRTIDYRTDYYSLGVTFYQMLSGALPFKANSPMGWVHAHIAKRPVPLNETAPHVPKALVDIIMKLLAKSPENRYQSAQGVVADLRDCSMQWSTHGTIEPFLPGRFDVSDRFQISRKLYGREIQANQMLKAFRYASEGNPSVLLVTGYSGVGKSSLVREMYQPVLERRGQFFAGAFEELKRDVPYHAIITAINELVNHLMTESKVRLENWREGIIDALDGQGQVLVEIVPKLEWVIGKQPAVERLPPKESRMRFFNLFNKFIDVFAKVEHPFVLFLDDLQWVDSASLGLLSHLLTSGGNQALFLMLSYRDNEVSATHSLMSLLEKLEEETIKLFRLELGPLTRDNLVDFIKDTLKLDGATVAPLAELVFEKTHGNPFFAGQFLQHLYETGGLVFNRELLCWQWDLRHIEASEMTENVVDMMADKIQMLPEISQELLRKAACIGKTFDLKVLSAICDYNLKETAQGLWESARIGLVTPIGDAHRVLSTDLSEVFLERYQHAEFRFAHDRIQQAAYSLLNDDQQVETHLVLARYMYHGFAEEERKEHLFEIVNQYNHGIDFLKDDEERLLIAQLNYAAGKQAKKANAYATVEVYLNISAHLIQDDIWDQDYEFAYSLYLDLAESAYLNTHFDKASELFDMLLEKSRSPLDKGRIYALQVFQYANMGDFGKSVEAGVSGMALLGVALPEDQEIILAELAQERERIAQRLINVDIQSLHDLPENKDPESTMVLSLFAQVYSQVLLGSQSQEYIDLMVCRMLNFALDHGRSVESAAVYCNYGFRLGSSYGEITQGHAFGALAVKTVEYYGSKMAISLVKGSVGSLLNHWCSHLRDSIPLLHDSFEAGIQTGQLVYPVFAASMFVTTKHCLGEKLPDLFSVSVKYKDFVRKAKFSDYLFYFTSYQRYAARLMDKEELMQKDDFGLEGIEKYMAEGQSQVLKQVHLLGELRYAYILSDFETAAQLADQIEADIPMVSGPITTMEYWFFGALAYLAICKKSGLGTLDSQRRERLERFRKEYVLFSETGPMNFLHCLQMIEGEIARLSGDWMQAMSLFDLAAANARHHEFLHLEAMALELSGRLFLSLKNDKVAALYFREASDIYADWGAQRKVKMLERSFPKLMRDVHHKVASVGNTTQTGTEHNKTTTDSLDLSSVFKASQTFSSEMELNQLLAKLMAILVENAGADRGVLILRSPEGEMFVEAESGVDDEGGTLLESLPLEEYARLPKSMVRLVARTQQNVVLSDDDAGHHFDNDPYVQQNHPKSVLCTPILYKRKLIGILYLENRVMEGAFTEDRLAVLRLLSSQAAISIEHARVYERLRDYNRTLEARVKERTREIEAKNDALIRTQKDLIVQEKMASLGTLTAGVAHEINNPTNFAHGSVQNLEANLTKFKEFFFDLIGEEADEEIIQAFSEKLEPLFRDLETIKEGTHRIKLIVRDLHAFSRKDQARVKQVKIIENLQSTINLVRSQFKEKVKFEAHYLDPIEIECQPAELNQVFMNLIVNSCQAIVRRLDSDTSINMGLLKVETKAEDGWGIIRFIDNGTGMSQDVLQKIFEPFFTTKPVGQGTGLGLSISYGIIQKHGGKVNVESKPGEGTTFTLSLPLERDADDISEPQIDSKS